MGEWETLPWWQQRVYLDGLTQEFYSDEEQEYGAAGAVTEIDLDDDPGVLAQFGIQMRAV